MTSRRIQIVLAFGMLVATFGVTAAQRTFVASTGNDANPCNLTLPCRSFGAALAQASPAGEVIVLDSAGYGSVVIAQSASIIAPPGVYAGVTVTGNIGVAIDAPGAEVVLRGLSINGQGGNTGILMLHGAKLTVEDCEISNLADIGIGADEGNLIVRNTVVRNAATGVGIVNGAHTTMLDSVRVDNCTNYGILVFGRNVTITNSVLTNNSTAGISVWADPVVEPSVNVMVSHSSISGSADAFVANAFAFGTATLVSDGNAISNASHAAFRFMPNPGTATIYSAGNNTVGTSVAAVEDGGTLTHLAQH